MVTRKSKNTPSQSQINQKAQGQGEDLFTLTLEIEEPTQQKTSQASQAQAVDVEEKTAVDIKEIAKTTKEEVKREKEEERNIEEMVRRKIEERISEIVPKDGVLVYSVVFDLPSEYMGMSSKTEKKDVGFVETRVLNKDPSLYRKLRVAFYNTLRTMAVRTKIGWVLINDDRVKELREIMNEFNKLSKTKRAVEIIPVILSKAWLDMEIEDYKKVLIERINELTKEIAKETIDAKKRARFEREKNKLEDLLRKIDEFERKLTPITTMK